MLITVREYAKKIGKPKGTVNSAIQAGRIPVVKKLNRFYIEDTTPWDSGRTGISSDPVYVTWQGMKQRCYNPKKASYKNYGGKGVKVCDEWLNPNVFAKWMYSHGWKKGLTIDRIDSNGDYCPENCRILTRNENSHFAGIGRRDSVLKKFKEKKWFVVRNKYREDWERDLAGHSIIKVMNKGFAYDDAKFFFARGGIKMSDVRGMMRQIEVPSDNYIRWYRTCLFCVFR